VPKLVACVGNWNIMVDVPVSYTHGDHCSLVPSRALAGLAKLVQCEVGLAMIRDMTVFVLNHNVWVFRKKSIGGFTNPTSTLNWCQGI
jgi:hypothetical protein